jgi:glycyl-tRNA synthetase (class II)
MQQFIKEPCARHRYAAAFMISCISAQGRKTNRYKEKTVTIRNKDDMRQKKIAPTKVKNNAEKLIE